MLHYTAVSSLFVSPVSLAFTHKPARGATGLQNPAWMLHESLLRVTAETSTSCCPGSSVPTSLKHIFNPSVSQMFWYRTWKKPILDLHKLYASQRSFVIYFLLMILGHQENVYLNNLGYVHMDRLKILLDVAISKMFSSRTPAGSHPVSPEHKERKDATVAFHVEIYLANRQACCNIPWEAKQIWACLAQNSFKMLFSPLNATLKFYF